MKFFLGFLVWVLMSVFVVGPVAFAESQPHASPMASPVADSSAVGVGMPEDTVAQFGQNSIDFTWLFLKTILAMVVVIAVAVVILRYVLPRLHGSRANRGGADVSIEDKISIDAKRALFVIKVEGRRLLIAASDNYMGLITELNPDEESETE